MLGVEDTPLRRGKPGGNYLLEIFFKIIEKKCVGIDLVCIFEKQITTKKHIMKAKDLKIGDTFKRQGWTYKVVNITADNYLNGNDVLLVSCIGKHKLYSPNLNEEIDSFFQFKPETKIN